MRTGVAKVRVKLILWTTAQANPHQHPTAGTLLHECCSQTQRMETRPSAQMICG